jgi:hypothetical protein
MAVIVVIAVAKDAIIATAINAVTCVVVLWCC